jgi:hypothetical protein
MGVEIGERRRILGIINCSGANGKKNLFGAEGGENI